ncbi:hypothetical protein ACVGOW_14765 [Pseudonocardia saturnea]
MICDALVYRAPMGVGRRDDPVAVERALREGICGMGGVVDPPPPDLDAALDSLSATGRERLAARLDRFAHVPDGAFVWTRSADGFVLGRLTGPWSYDGSAAARVLDLVHVRPCRWLPDPTPESQVPAATLATFARGGRNFQRTHDPHVGARSRAVWEAAAR